MNPEGWSLSRWEKNQDSSFDSCNLDGAHRGWGVPCNRRGALLRGPVKQKAARTRRSDVPPVKSKPRLGRVDNRSGVPCSRGKLAPRADARLAEQARNRDHHSSDPCGQAKKQKNITQEHRHVTPPSPTV